MEWTEGEKYVQKKIWGQLNNDMPNYTRNYMTLYEKELLENSNYIFISFLDNDNRPWANIITGKKGFIKVVNKKLEIKLDENENIINNLLLNNKNKKQKIPVGCIYIDFNKTLSRHKFSGFLDIDKNNSDIKLKLSLNEFIGLCPKYITKRKLYYSDNNINEVRNNSILNYKNNKDIFPKECIDIICNTSTSWLATIGLDHMGINHRGGNPGFLRYNDGNIYIPEYSGNKYYSSLGNIEETNLAGISIFDFDNNKILCITGDSNIIYSDNSSEIMYNSKIIIKIKITGFIYLENALNIKSSENILNPYNPEIDYLILEKKRNINEVKNNVASLISIEKITPTISKFNFKTSKSIKYNSGQFVILDFSKIYKNKYQHMNDDDPQSLNDNLIRSWTITSNYNIKNNKEFSITVRKQNKISKFLHNSINISVPMKGIGGNFVYKGEKALFIAAGIGVTPFLSFLSSDIKNDIILLLSIRYEDINLTKIYDKNKLKKEYIFITNKGRRMDKEDILKINNYKSYVWYACGPSKFISQLSEWANELNIEINTEQFYF